MQSTKEQFSIPASQRQDQLVLRGARGAAFANGLFVQQHFQRGLETETRVLKGEKINAAKIMTE